MEATLAPGRFVNLYGPTETPACAVITKQLGSLNLMKLFRLANRSQIPKSFCSMTIIKFLSRVKWAKSA